MNLCEKIITLQCDDDWYKEFKDFIGENKMMVTNLEEFTLEKYVLLRFKSRIYMPPNERFEEFDPK
jgi:hypothetical protein